MSWLSSSIARKVAMALSGLFLVSFLLMHVSINMFSVFSADLYNEASHFMGTNPIVQFMLQPVLIVGVVFHFVLGIALEIKNKQARPIKYAKKKTDNAPWASQNMILSGLVVLAFLGLHFVDFWIPEINYKYIEQNPEISDRYYGELVHKFANPLRVGAYVISFVLLALHLLHGFQSSLQSMGINNKFTPAIKKFTQAYAVIVPLAFIFIALYHFINQ